jgi:predicted PurR-regulated permease PerM
MIDPDGERDGQHRQLFSEGELRLFRYTAVLFAALALAGLIMVGLWALATVFAFFYNILMPLAIAGVLALVLFPVVTFMERHLRMSRPVAVIVLFTLFTAALVTAALYVLPAAIRQASSLIETGPDMLAQWGDWFVRRFPWLAGSVEALLTNENGNGPAIDLEAAGERVRSYVGLIVGMVFVPLFLFFALLSGDRIDANVRAFLSVFRAETEREVLFLGNLFIEYVTAFFRGQLVIALIMGAMYALGFTLIGIEAAIVIGLFLGLLNIVPYLGAIVGLITVLPVAYLQPDGGLVLVGLALLVFLVVQTIESLFLTPKIMADRSGLHPAVVVISIFFWGALLGGLIGMILAVPLSAFIATAWRHIRGRLRHSFVTDDTARTRLAEEDDRRLQVNGPGKIESGDRS